MADFDFSKIYSYSKLDLFDQCPQKYYFNYLDPEIAPIKKQFLKPKDYNTKGSAVHGAITLFYHLPKKERIFDNLKKCLKEAWYSELDIYRQPPLGLLGGFKDIEHERETYLESLRQLRNFLEIEKEEKPNPFYVPIKTIRKSFKDYERMIKFLNSKVAVSGKFDRIDELEDGGLRVVDFKTGKSKNGIDQLEFYKLLAEMNFNKKVKKVSYHYLNNGKVDDFDVSKTKTADIKKKILKKVKEIEETKEFNPRPSHLCNYCDFKEICPVFKPIES